MMTFDEALAAIDELDAGELTLWIEQRWIVPEHRSGEYQFSDIDMARLRLICDMRFTFEVEQETVPLLLSLLDQIYTSRRQMRQLVGAVSEQPEEIRESIFKLFHQSSKETEDKTTPSHFRE